MKLVVGLGNPGKKYYRTRHNVGYLVIDNILKSGLKVSPHLVKKYKALVYYKQSKNVLFVKPLTMMNNSGESVKIIVDQYKVKMPNLWIIYDDLDLELGAYKIQKGIGPKDHKGLLSIYEKLGKKDFWHVRIGVNNRKKKENYISGEQYVLQDFNDDEMKIIDKVIKKVIDELITKIF